MTTTLLLAAPGALVALAVVCWIAAAMRRRPALGAALDQLAAPPDESVEAQPMSDRVGSWVERRLPDLPIFATPTRDLRLVGSSPERFYWDKTLLALVGALGPAVFGVVMGGLGYLPGTVPALLGIPLGIAMFFVPDRELRSTSKRSRNEFARAVAVYLELVAAERRRGAPAAQSLASAADVGTSWVFARIREELVRARLAGIAPWTALARLSDDIGVTELADVAGIVRLSGEEGASVAESLRARGRTLRVQLLNDDHTDANRASERMSMPLTCLAFVFVGIVLTPLVMNLFT